MLLSLAPVPVLEVSMLLAVDFPQRWKHASVCWMQTHVLLTRTVELASVSLRNG